MLWKEHTSFPTMDRSGKKKPKEQKGIRGRGGERKKGRRGSERMKDRN